MLLSARLLRRGGGVCLGNAQIDGVLLRKGLPLPSGSMHFCIHQKKYEYAKRKPVKHYFVNLVPRGVPPPPPHLRTKFSLRKKLPIDLCGLSLEMKKLSIRAKYVFVVTKATRKA